MTPASSVLLLTTLTGFGYGLIAWLGVLAALGFLPPAPLFVPVAVVVGARLRQCRPRRLHAASRPSGTGLARLQPMAFLLAVARRRRGARHLPAGARLRRRSGGCSARMRSRRALLGAARGGARPGHRRLHRDDLCEPEADPPMAQPAYGAGLPDLRGVLRRRAARRTLVDLVRRGAGARGRGADRGARGLRLRNSPIGASSTRRSRSSRSPPRPG